MLRGTQQVANVDRTPVQDRSADDEIPAEREHLAEPIRRPEPAVLGHEAEAIAFDLEDRRVVGLAETGGGTSDGGKDGSEAAR